MKKVVFELGFETSVGLGRQKGSILRGGITRAEACKRLTVRKAENSGVFRHAGLQSHWQADLERRLETKS